MSKDNGQNNIPFSIGDISSINGQLTSKNRALTDNVYGFNHRQIGNAIPINKVNQGYVFFTRPQLNMSIENISTSRYFNKLLNDNEDSKSIYRIIRATLDPRLQAGFGANNPLSCPLVDNNLGFIPCLTNQIISCSGFPDKVIPTYTSSEGMYKEATFMYDGIYQDYTVRDINCTFRNTLGSIAFRLLDMWMTYGSLIFQFIVSKYPDYIVRNEIDYNTRIYRILLDSSKRYVEEIAATGASAPTNISTGALFDFNIEKPLLDANKEFSVPFKSNGVIMNDEILLYTFNEVTKIFHPLMRDESRDSSMIAIPYDYLRFFNHRGYPFINLDNYEFLWYIEKSYFEAKMKSIKNINEYLYSDSQEA